MIMSTTRIVALAAAQLALVGGAVAPQLISRTTGEDYRMRVAPVDPIDPFRGAYVTLGYPDLRLGEDRGTRGEDGEVYLTLVEEGGFWVLDERTRTRPEDGPYLTCQDRSWELRCGIESFFAPQDEALRLEEGLADGGVATVRIDDRGVGTVMAVDGE
ncbi:GDYXXLXY domain-containing protein [Nocardioides coralli]|uniref:GDYXXLXY domain-containing protein n=1 Tax=Nocardioides coralli TaxID=2872154 RepID=UPI001CA3FEDB|nr:GDYXXLXY domain-containing protein [Nocardioides coralli]QZY28703.1 GDYXXLXY domain-containing protein [Nocardioides coralli]